jgi:hypothetical protein
VLPADGGSAPLIEFVDGTLQVTVDVVEYFDCNTPQPVTTYRIPAQGLPAGSYELELIGRALLSPEFTHSFQAVPLLVASPGAPFAIPTLHWPVMVILVTLLGIYGAAAGRKFTGAARGAR